jgi:hypothetical protein
MAGYDNQTCGACAHCVDHREDALIWCEQLKMYVVRASLGCALWTDTKVF